MSVQILKKLGCKWLDEFAVVVAAILVIYTVIHTNTTTSNIKQHLNIVTELQALNTETLDNMLEVQRKHHDLLRQCIKPPENKLKTPNAAANQL